MSRQTLQAKESAPAKKKISFSWLRPAAAHPAAEAEHEAPSASSSSFTHDFTKVPVRPMQLPGVPGFSCPFAPQRCPSGGACHTCPPKMQAKLKIGQPGDMYEQEADRVAEQVMRMPEPQVQRKGCSAPGCKDEDEDKLVQTKSAGNAGNAQVDHPLIQSVLSSPGQPLDAATRSFMEPRFGQDFSGVRVHLGGEAAESARAVNARAYTVGRNVVFDEGQYAPGSDEGRRLVAHELMHVSQQRALPKAQMPIVQTYRPKGSSNFGKCGPDNKESYFPKKTDEIEKVPWIEKITIKFTGTKLADGVICPTGNLTATYAANSAKLNDIKLNILGGQASEGLSDVVTNKTVERIEGCGYHHKGVPSKERISSNQKYYKPNLAETNATMNFAVFYIQTKASGNQAIHYGPLDHGSLGCVHVDDWSKMQQINYHSVQGKTKITISYSSSALQAACCARFSYKGSMVHNPCGSIEPKKCPPKT